jgi:hypothetical protein
VGATLILEIVWENWTNQYLDASFKRLERLHDVDRGHNVPV